MLGFFLEVSGELCFWGFYFVEKFLVMVGCLLEFLFFVVLIVVGDGGGDVEDMYWVKCMVCLFWNYIVVDIFDVEILWCRIIMMGYLFVGMNVMLKELGYIMLGEFGYFYIWFFGIDGGCKDYWRWFKLCRRRIWC